MAKKSSGERFLYRSNKILFAGLLLFGLAVSSWGVSPLSGKYGARPLALGNAFTAQADDANAIFINSAGLSDIKLAKLISNYGQIDADTSFTSLAAALPTGFGGMVGAGYRNLTVSNIAISTETMSHTEQELVVSLANKIGKKLAVGLNLRLIGKGLSQDISGYDYLYASGSAFDFFAKFPLTNWWSVGGSIQNIDSRLTYRSGTEEKLPLTAILGNSWQIAGETALIKRENESGILNLDLNKASGDPILLSAGLEWWLQDSFAFRCGINQSSATDLNNGNKTTFTNLAGGVGMNYGGVTIDYTFYKSGDPGGGTVNYLSLGYVGTVEPRVIFRRKLKEFNYPSGEALLEKKLKRVHFSDVSKEAVGREEIELLATAGLVTAYEGNDFQPELAMNRIMFANMVLRAKNVYAQNPLTAVGGQAWKRWPKKAVSRKEAATILGLNITIDRPNAQLTRGETAILIYQTAFGQAAIKRLPPLID
ncbi:hypothetical protein A2311_06185 [candidate division WOR-1 bacterium RIFOXYB2_FULL_48_7]|uniref:SLH domain-containing protein n=1 Tax=candidate division WOR-1 bacterium RIFOXYB2_FULL_48_7 TaxID=1802583 RepID=A0A1F4TLE8_UNCSA|nr:MAG: hypothetical protein A2311_06185 [candidate division WOR-1 bacterium RIFOXYB2_FULL_48_7]